MNYVIALGLTLAFELGLALIWGIRKRDLILVVLVNVLTNPAVNLIHSLLLGQSLLFHTVLPELAAVAVEALLYCRLENSIRRPVLFAILANLFSYSMGLILMLVLK